VTLIIVHLLNVFFCSNIWYILEVSALVLVHLTLHRFL